MVAAATPGLDGLGVEEIALLLIDWFYSIKESLTGDNVSHRKGRVSLIVTPTNSTFLRLP